VGVPNKFQPFCNKSVADFFADKCNFELGIAIIQPLSLSTHNKMQSNDFSTCSISGMANMSNEPLDISFPG
jgi:hypothetical protein